MARKKTQPSASATKYGYTKRSLVGEAIEAMHELALAADEGNGYIDAMTKSVPNKDLVANVRKLQDATAKMREVRDFAKNLVNTKGDEAHAKNTRTAFSHMERRAQR